MSDFYKIAISNISKKGDTEIFPYPNENSLLYGKPKEVEDILIGMGENLDKLVKTSTNDPGMECYFLTEVLNIAGKRKSKYQLRKNGYLHSHNLRVHGNFDILSTDSGVKIRSSQQYRKYGR